LTAKTHGYPAVSYSLPTRRSSDLPFRPVAKGQDPKALTAHGDGFGQMVHAVIGKVPAEFVLDPTVLYPRAVDAQQLSYPWVFSRSEEHTSELQSRENLVCRLLLEK